MFKKNLMLLMTISILLVGCGDDRVYNEEHIIDWSYYNDDFEDSHVAFARNNKACFSDGKHTNNVMFDEWVKKLKEDTGKLPRLEFD